MLAGMSPSTSSGGMPRCHMVGRMAAPVESIDAYLSPARPRRSQILTEIRRRVHVLVPDVEEAIQYRMPTFLRNGDSFLHLAAWRRHVSIYPLPPEFEGEPGLDASGKGTGRFPLSAPVPTT